VCPWSWNFSDKSQMVCQRKIFWDLAELNIIIPKYAKVKKAEKCIQFTWKWRHLVINSAILRNSLFTSNQCSLGAGTSLTSLRWFVKEKLSEISQSSTWLYQNMQKLQKLRNVYKFTWKWRYLVINSVILRNSLFTSDYTKICKSLKTLKMYTKHTKKYDIGSLIWFFC